MNLSVTSAYARAYVEILEIINYMGQEYKKKIPSKLLNLFEKNKDLNYEYKLEKLDLNTQFLKETLILLALIEKKYWATDREREILNQALKENEKKYQEDLRKKYNPDSLFMNNNSNKVITTTAIEETNVATTDEQNDFSMTEYHETIFVRIKNWIKRFFNK